MSNMAPRRGGKIAARNDLFFGRLFSLSANNPLHDRVGLAFPAIKAVEDTRAINFIDGEPSL
jgi:hypothetical protein